MNPPENSRRFFHRPAPPPLSLWRAPYITLPFKSRPKLIIILDMHEFTRRTRSGHLVNNINHIGCTYSNIINKWASEHEERQSPVRR